MTGTTPTPQAPPRSTAQDAAKDSAAHAAPSNDGKAKQHDPDALRDQYGDKIEKGRDITPTDPEFILKGAGTGWFSFECAASPEKPPPPPPPQQPQQPQQQAEKDKQHRPKPTKIEGSVEARTREEAMDKIRKVYPGAQFREAPAPMANPVRHDNVV